MRILALALILTGVLPGLAFADSKVEEYIQYAITAVKTRSYEARMKFLSPFNSGQEQNVHIYHVAPELYRVTPLENGSEGSLVYIENAVDLSRVQGGYVETMPVRQFFNNDAMTVKFLRDLGRHAGTTLLEGTVGNKSVYVLRQNTSQEKPYTITVGLDKENFFPLFLLVTDTEGDRRVYYEMEVIEFCDSLQLQDDLFVPQGEFDVLPAPRMKSPSFSQQVVPQSEFNGVGAQIDDLPLIPMSSSLPPGFVLESISKLAFPAKGGSDHILVYHLEIFGPRGEVLSIFETQSVDFSLDAQQENMDGDDGYVLACVDKWVVAAFGSQPADILLAIIDNLQKDNFKATQLLGETLARQRFMDSLD